MSQPKSMTIHATALLFAAATAVASPASAEPGSCSTVAARDVMTKILPRADDDRPVNVTFRTHAEGVSMPLYLTEQYPDEITIILQYQFDRLVVRDTRFDVTVYFKGKPARLTIPFDAVKSFYDDNVAKCAGG